MKIRLKLICAIMLLVAIGCGKDEEKPSEDFTDTMAREHAGDRPTGNDVAWLQPAQPVDVNDISYPYGDGATASAYLARPSNRDSTLPGIILIHEWWGLNDNMKAMARRVAGDGYIALAINLYGDRAATSPEEAKAFMQQALKDSAKGLRNIEAAIKALKARQASEVAVMGWCFGGGWSLRTAYSFPEQIEAAVIYYGHLETDPKLLDRLDMPVLGIFGEKDEGIPIEQVKRFEAVLDSLDVDGTILIYPNAEHAFANPSGERYNAQAATDAWKQTTAFLAKHLK